MSPLLGLVIGKTFDSFKEIESLMKRLRNECSNPLQFQQAKKYKLLQVDSFLQVKITPLFVLLSPSFFLKTSVLKPV